MNSSLKKIVLLALLVGIVGGVVAMFIYNKPHQDLADGEADAHVAAATLFADFESDETKANAQYLGKLIEVQGTIGEIRPTEDGGSVVVLKGDADLFGVSCGFLPAEQASTSSLEVGQDVVIRGLCDGFLMDVTLSRCIIAE